jgi:hypothetical protein
VCVQTSQLQHREYYYILKNFSRSLWFSNIDEIDTPVVTSEDFVQRGYDLNNKPDSTIEESDQMLLNNQQTSIITDISKKNQISI